jgi:hypothetical protein
VEKLWRGLNYNVSDRSMCESCGHHTVGWYTTIHGRLTCAMCRNFDNNLITLGTFEMMETALLRPCRFCRRVEVKKHFDHMNMFDKVDSIGRMAASGRSRAIIESEMRKCQVLCVECHAVVTRYEIRCGFFKEKRKLNRLRKKHDVSEMLTDLRESYARKMDPLYSWMDKNGHRFVTGGEGGQGGLLGGVNL